MPSNTSNLIKVTICIDDSKGSKTAFNWALEKLLTNKHQVTLINIPKFITPPTLLISPLTNIDFEFDCFKNDVEFGKRASIEILKEFSSRLDDLCIQHQIVSAFGDKEELVLQIESSGAEIVVIGSRGLGDFGRFALGSVSDHVVHHCKCTVIVVK